MSQAFSLYSELTVRQNLALHARLFHVPEAQIAARVDEMAERFDLPVMDALPEAFRWASASACRWRWRWCTSRRC